MQSSDLQLSRVHSAQDPAFEQLFRIYLEANAPSERKSKERLAAMVEEPDYHFLVGMASGGIVGYLILRAFEGSDAALLEYLAVSHDRRNQGVGSALLAKAVSLEAFRSKFLLAEVNSDKKGGAEQAKQTRRKAFYRRLGWREIEGLDYMMPPVSSTLPPEMDMLVFRNELPASLERDRLRQWLECIYAEVYHRPSNDPRLEAMMRMLPERVPLI